MEHRHRLEDALQPLRVGDVVVGDVREVLRMDPEVRVQVGQNDAAGIEAHPVQLASQHRPAVRHGCGFPDDDPWKERILDMKERAKPW